MARRQTTLQRRMSAFVDWLAPDPARETQIRQQAHDIRERIRAAAHGDGLRVHSTPSAGSFEKRTGVRRHVTGGANVAGFDVDLPFVVSARSNEEHELGFLLGRFDRYAAQLYPQVRRERTKSAIALDFTGKHRRFDLVPMLATGVHTRQLLIRATGERVETSVEQHVDFIRRRTEASNRLRGRVKFNECVRLVKWWRSFRQTDARLDVSSFVIGLLCADAYDHCQVEATYIATLERWFHHMRDVVRGRRRVAFRDYQSRAQSTAPAVWQVLDPVNPSNNVVKGWTVWEVDQLAAWLDQAVHACQQAMERDARGVDHEALHWLVQLFGTPVKHHCGG